MYTNVSRRRNTVPRFYKPMKRLAVLTGSACLFFGFYANADTLLFEDFSTEDAFLDTWQNVWGTNSAETSPGELFLTGDNAYLITDEPAIQDMNGTSVRTQIAFDRPDQTTSGGIGILVNGDADALTAYQGGYNPVGNRLYVGWNGSSYQGFRTESADFDLVAGEELILQFDVFDNKLDLWAWRPGESMPAEPQISYVDESVNLAPGVPGVLFDAKGTSSSATFRYLRVDDEPIPAPIQLASGDYNGDGTLDVSDIDLQASAIHEPNADLAVFDENDDGQVNVDDRMVLIIGHFGTWMGDSNLDGEFNSTDFVQVFSAAEYEDNVVGNSTWSTGDWNGDSEFSSADFVVAFQDGGFEQGPRPNLVAVPEPVVSTGLLLVAAFVVRRNTLRF